LDEFEFEHPYKYEIENIEMDDRLIEIEEIKESR